MGCGPRRVSKPMLGVPREVGNADRSDEKEAVARPLPCLDPFTVYMDRSGMTSSRSKRIWSSLGTVGTSRSLNVIGFLS